MKKILPLLLIIAVWAIGCKDDDKSAAFVGTWIGQSLAISNCDDPNRNMTDKLSCDSVSCYKLILNSNKTFSFQERTRVTEGTWSRGELLSLCVEDDGETICDEYIAFLQGASLILNSDTASSGCVTTYDLVGERFLDTSSN